MATHSSILAWKVPWREKFDGSIGSQRVGQYRALSTPTQTHAHTHTHTHTHTHRYIPRVPISIASLIRQLFIKYYFGIPI